MINVGGGGHGDAEPELPMPEFGDIRDVLVALPHGDPYGGTNYVMSDLFPVRHDLIAALLDPPPASVFEFGTLYGYFLVTALHAAPSIRRVGWIDNEKHTPESNRKAYENLRATRPGASDRTRYQWGRSRYDLHLLERHWDLVQVDAEHSYEECLADLRAAELMRPRWIFVDDWTAIAPVADAVAEFLKRSPNKWALTEHETVNGLAVLTRLVG